MIQRKGRLAHAGFLAPPTWLLEQWYVEGGRSRSSAQSAVRGSVPKCSLLEVTEPKRGNQQKGRSRSRPWRSAVRTVWFDTQSSTTAV